MALVAEAQRDPISQRTKEAPSLKQKCEALWTLPLIDS